MKRRFSVQKFLDYEGSSSAILMSAALLGMAFANSPVADTYTRFLNAGFTLENPYLFLTTTKVINYISMSFFFFVVGMEIKRELTSGHLSTLKKAVAPFMAALGGMIVPALIFIAIVDSSLHRGWAIPIATDIALAVGVLAIAGSRVSLAMKTFLLALAVIDDLGAIAVIALFYSQSLAPWWLILAGVAALAFYFVSRSTLSHPVILGALVILIWYGFYRSGVHPTLSGVVLGFLVSGNEELEEKLHPWTSYLIIPLFAFANAGVAFSISEIGKVMTSALGIAIFCGMVVGKPLGIIAFTKGAAALNLAETPERSHRFSLLATGSAAGIGFTVAIFIAQLAFANKELQNQAILAVIIASVVSALLSVLFNFVQGVKK